MMLCECFKYQEMKKEINIYDTVHKVDHIQELPFHFHR